MINPGSGEIPQLHAVLQKAPSVRAGGVFVRNRTIGPKAFECGILGCGSSVSLPACTCAASLGRMPRRPSHPGGVLLAVRRRRLVQSI
jgi:hypothetical protein